MRVGEVDVREGQQVDTVSCAPGAGVPTISVTSPLVRAGTVERVGVDGDAAGNVDVGEPAVAVAADHAALAMVSEESVRVSVKTTMPFASTRLRSTASWPPSLRNTCCSVYQPEDGTT